MNRVRRILVLFAAVIVILVPFSARAGVMSEDVDSLRCGNDLVEIGETQLKVLHECGMPDVSNSYYAVGGTLDKWTYNRGPTDFIYVFTFLNGELRNIQQTDRGF